MGRHFRFSILKIILWRICFNYLMWWISEFGYLIRVFAIQ
uniref:Uncharacterized protein n=1 Tax=Vibrio splendidus TaxID=29497 RepID=A0A0H3ZMK6_VIBSP|nr:hypothetical protein [Vibrio splendidus]